MSTQLIRSTADTNLAVVKKGPGQVNGWYLYNTNGAARYLKLFDAANTADVTLGTTTPFLVIPIATVAKEEAHGQCILFKLGLVMAIVTTAPDTGSTGVSANDIIGALQYDRPGKC